MKVGKKMELLMGNDISFLATIESLSTQGIIIAVDSFQKKNEIDEGQIVRARFHDDKGSLNEFEFDVKKRIRSTNLLLVSYPTKYRKVQRRNFYRIKVWEDMFIHYSDQDVRPTPPWVNIRGMENMYLKPPRGYIKAQVSDISAQGLAFFSNDKLKPSKNVGLILSFLNPPVRVIGRVVRCVEQEGHYKVSIMLQKMNKLDSGRLMKFVFEKQSSMLAVNSAESANARPDKTETFHPGNNNSSENGRRAFRLSNLAIPISFKVVNDFHLAMQSYQPAVLRNISITGASFITDNKIPFDSQVWIKMSIGDDEISFWGRCLRSKPIGEINKYEVALKFKAIDAKSNKRLVSFIFDQHEPQNMLGSSN